MSLARDTITVGSGTLMSRLLAFARDSWIAALLGTGPAAEAFFAVLQLINFFRRLLADGALNAAFVPIWLSLRNGEDGVSNANRFTKRCLLAVGCVAGGVALLVIAFAPDVATAIAPGFKYDSWALTTYLLALVAPYIALAGLVAVIAAALNSEGRVGAVTISTIVFNLVLLLTLALISRTNFFQGEITFLLAGAVVAAGLCQLVITGTVWLATGKRWPRTTVRVPDQTRLFFVRTVPGLIAAGIPQLKLIAGAAIASSSAAGVSWLYYANRLYELPLGVASIAIAAVVVPRIAASLRDSDCDAYSETQSRGFEIALGLALPAAAGFALLAGPIAGGLFERGAFGPTDTAAVASALAAICAGLPGHVLEKVFGAVSFAQGDTHTPMIAALCGLAAAIAGGVLLFPSYGHVGVAAGIAISGWVGAAILAVVLRGRGWLRLDPTAMKRLPRIVLAALIMSAAVGYGLVLGHTLWPALTSALSGRVILLAALVTLGIAIYLAAIQILGVAKLTDLVAAVLQKN
jgi:putative peptidoglycan lipid II flippase